MKGSVIATRSTPVKFFVGIRISDETPVELLKERLVAAFGPIDYEASLTDGPIALMLLSFERLIQPDQGPEIGIDGLVEESGYIENTRAVIVAVRELRIGIHHFANNMFQPVGEPGADWSQRQSFLLQVRQIYRSQLRTMCILNREETS